MMPPLTGVERVSAQITPYCSPAAAVVGTVIVTLAVITPRTGTSDELGWIEVHVERAFEVWPTAPMNESFAMKAAAAYNTM
jgi:hypothetical protein